MFDKLFEKLDSKLKETKEYVKSEEFKNKVEHLKEDVKKLSKEVESKGKTLIDDFKSKSKNDVSENSNEPSKSKEETYEEPVEFTYNNSQEKTEDNSSSVEEIVVEKVSIEDSNLPTALKKSLISAGFSTLDEVQSLSEDELLNIKGIGRASLPKIKSAE